MLALKLFRGWQVDSLPKTASSSRQLVLALAAPEALRHFRTLSVGPQADIRVGLGELLPLMPVSTKFYFFFRPIAADIRANALSQADIEMTQARGRCQTSSTR